MRVIDARAIRPVDIKPGDVMLFTVKAVMGAPGRYRIYRCSYPNAVEVTDRDFPQGSRILNEKEVCEALFPSLARVAEPDTL